MSAAKPASRWTCTNCGRRVPADVAECHCGTTRRVSEARVAPEGGKTTRGLRVPDFLGQLAVLGIVFYLGLTWQQTRKDIPPPMGRPLILPPDPVPPRPPLPAPPLTPAPFEPRLPAVAPTPDEAYEQPSPDPTPSPEMSPSPSPKPQRSELDVKREQAEKHLDQVLARLAGEAQRLSANAGQFESICVGGRGEPASCARVLAQISASAESLSRGMQEAEEEARHAWVTPGFVRDLRTRHGLDEATIGDLVARVGRMASSFGGQK